MAKLTKRIGSYIKDKFSDIEKSLEYINPIGVVLDTLEKLPYRPDRKGITLYRGGEIVPSLQEPSIKSPLTQGVNRGLNALLPGSDPTKNEREMHASLDIYDEGVYNLPSQDIGKYVEVSKDGIPTPGVPLSRPKTGVSFEEEPLDIEEIDVEDKFSIDPMPVFEPYKEKTLKGQERFDAIKSAGFFKPVIDWARDSARINPFLGSNSLEWAKGLEPENLSREDYKRLMKAFQRSYESRYLQKDASNLYEDMVRSYTGIGF